MKRYHIFLIAGLFTAVIAFAFTKKHQPIVKLNASNGFALVELYTSEGCSSCPPADKLLAKIQQEYKGKEVYVLAYHVDYWNRLGWKDVFSNAVYSQRQRAYSAYLNVDGVYTPQAIVNGHTEFVGSDESKMQSAIQQSLGKNTTVSLALNDVKISRNKAMLQYQVNGADAGSNLLLAVIEKHAITHVQSGENGGRTLPHVNIVQGLQTISLKSETGTAEIALPAGFNTKDWAITGFVQNKSNGQILAAKNAVLDNKEIAAIK